MMHVQRKEEIDDDRSCYQTGPAKKKNDTEIIDFFTPALS